MTQRYLKHRGNGRVLPYTKLLARHKMMDPYTPPEAVNASEIIPIDMEAAQAKAEAEAQAKAEAEAQAKAEAATPNTNPEVPPQPVDTPLEELSWQELKRRVVAAGQVYTNRTEAILMLRGAE